MTDVSTTWVEVIFRDHSIVSHTQQKDWNLLEPTNDCWQTSMIILSFRSVNTTMVKLTNTISFNGPVLKHHTFHFTLKMTSPLFVETSVLNNRSFQNYLTWMIRIYKLLNMLLGSDHLPRNKFYLIVRCTNIAAMTLCASKLSAIMCWSTIM